MYVPVDGLYAVEFLGEEQRPSSEFFKAIAYSWVTGGISAVAEGADAEVCWSVQLYFDNMSSTLLGQRGPVPRHGNLEIGEQGADVVQAPSAPRNPTSNPRSGRFGRSKIQ